MSENNPERKVPKARKVLIKLRRRKRVAELYLAGAYQHEIAEELQVANGTIFKDLQEIRKEWLKEIFRDFNDKKAEELAKIDHLESVAWEAWYRSCKNNETKRLRREYGVRLPSSTSGGDQRGRRGNRGGSSNVGSETTPLPKPSLLRVYEDKIVRGQCGDPRFLERVEWAITTRLKLLGLLDDDKGGRVVIDWDTLIKNSASKATNSVPQTPQVGYNESLGIDNDEIEKRIREEEATPVVVENLVKPVTDGDALPNGLKELSELPDLENGEQHRDIK